jgi:hypothetical protein
VTATSELLQPYDPEAHALLSNQHADKPRR